jgi:hypothetical protein
MKKHKRFELIVWQGKNLLLKFLKFDMYLSWVIAFYFAIRLIYTQELFVYSINSLWIIFSSVLNTEISCDLYEQMKK